MANYLLGQDDDDEQKNVWGDDGSTGAMIKGSSPEDEEKAQALDAAALSQDTGGASTFTGEGLSNGQKIAMAAVGLLPALLGGAIYGKDGAMLGGAAGAKAGSDMINQLGKDEQAEKKRQAMLEAARIRSSKGGGGERPQIYQGDDGKAHIGRYVAGKGLVRSADDALAADKPGSAGAKPVPYQDSQGKTRIGRMIGSEIQRDEANDPLAPKSGDEGSKAFTQENEIRQAWNTHPVTRVTFGMRPNYEKMVYAASKPSAAGDIALIFNYMKLLDPNSSVREGEQASVQNAAGVPQQIANLYNNLKSGAKLGDDQRADIMAQARGAWEAQMRLQSQIDAQYAGVARASGFDPSHVVNASAFTLPAAKSKGSASAANPDDGVTDILTHEGYKYGIKDGKDVYWDGHGKRWMPVTERKGH